MKLIGVIGGMSWESSLEYYRVMNETVKEKLGGWHSARVLMYSVDFHEIEMYQSTGDWKAAADMLSTAAVSLEKGGLKWSSSPPIPCTRWRRRLKHRSRFHCFTLPMPWRRL